MAGAPIGILDRLLRGRAWVLCIGVLLAGVVYLNVTLLELNSGIAGMADRAAELKRENSGLRDQVGRLGSTERVQREAAKLDFTMPKPQDVRYLDSDPASDARRAARALEGATVAAAEAPVEIPAEPAAVDEPAAAVDAVPAAQVTPDDPAAPAPDG
jgi:hypothetical protein